MDSRENKISVIKECLAALERGVDRPTIVMEDDGTYSYIPHAYLFDASYTGSRAVVNYVDGYTFDADLDLDDDAEVQLAAEWAADTWDWYYETDERYR